MRLGAHAMLASLAFTIACTPKSPSLLGKWVDSKGSGDWLTLVTDTTFSAGSGTPDSVTGRYTHVGNEITLTIPNAPPIKMTVAGDSLMIPPMNGGTTPKVFRRKP